MDSTEPVMPDFAKKGGIVPVIVQEFHTGQVLMQAWMNKDAWQATLERGRAVYWSTSRQELWEKGLTSGHTQIIREIYLDCDQDAILLKVDQAGAIACHTGKPSCFFYQVPINLPDQKEHRD